MKNLFLLLIMAFYLNAYSQITTNVVKNGDFSQGINWNQNLDPITIKQSDPEVKDLLHMLGGAKGFDNGVGTYFNIKEIPTHWSNNVQYTNGASGSSQLEVLSYFGRGGGIGADGIDRGSSCARAFENYDGTPFLGMMTKPDTKSTLLQDIDPIKGDILYSFKAVFEAISYIKQPVTMESKITVVTSDGNLKDVSLFKVEVVRTEEYMNIDFSDPSKRIQNGVDYSGLFDRYLQGHGHSIRIIDLNQDYELIVYDLNTGEKVNISDPKTSLLRGHPYKFEVRMTLEEEISDLIFVTDPEYAWYLGDVQAGVIDGGCLPSATNIDTDGDGIADICDLDDDNDGIMDIDECSTDIEFSSVNTNNSTYFGYGTYLNLPEEGLVVDFNTLSTGSFNMIINGNGQTILNEGDGLIGTDPNRGGALLSFKEGIRDLITGYSSDITIPAATSIPNIHGLPRLRVVLTKSGEIRFFGTKSPEDPNLHSMYLLSGSTRSFGELQGNISVELLELNELAQSGSVTTGAIRTQTCNNFFATDLDSDRDGCFDAIEAGAYTDQVSENGDITGEVDYTGLPDAYPFLYGTQVSSIGTSQDPTISSNCQDPCDPNFSNNIDTDGDGVTDLCDLDDDNDGIPDEIECESLSTSFTLEASRENKYYGYNKGLVIKETIIDFNNLDDAVSVFVNGKELIDPESRGYLEVASNNVLEGSIAYLEGKYIDHNEGDSRLSFSNTEWEGYNQNTFSDPWVPNVYGLPRLRIVIDATGNVSLFGTQNRTDASLSPMYLADGRLNKVAPNTAYEDELNFIVKIIQVAGYDKSSASGSVTWKYCDGDYATNLNSDGDTCWDALEAGATVDQINPFTGMLLGQADENGQIDIDPDTEGVQFFTRIGTSQDALAISSSCNNIDSCISEIPGYTDTDGDGVADDCDLDDDNDGILDIDECETIDLEFKSDVERKFSTEQSPETKVSVIDFSYYDAAVEIKINGLGIIEDTSLGYNAEPAKNVIVASVVNESIDIQNGHSRLSFNSNYEERYIDKPQLPNINNLPRLRIVYNRVTGSLEMLGTKSVDDIVMSPMYILDGTFEEDLLTPRSTNEQFIMEILPVLTPYQYSEYAKSTGTVHFRKCDGDYATNLDSDGDGCWDALEAGASVDQVDPNTGRLLGEVNENGVIDTNPNLSDTQTNPIGSSQDENVIAFSCIDRCDPQASGNPDFDGDGVTDICDLDDDNDGILDVDECPYEEVLFSTPVGQTFTYSEEVVTNGIIIDFNQLDDATKVYVNDQPIIDPNSTGYGNALSNNILEGTVVLYQGVRPDHNPGDSRISFTQDTWDGYDQSTYSDPWVPNKNRLPRLRVVVAADGSVELFGTQTINDTALAPVYLADGELNNVGVLSDNVKIDLVQVPGFGGSIIIGSIKINSCSSDYATNHDSDGDGCWDALEGGATLSQIDNNTGMLLGTVDENGVIDTDSATAGTQTNPVGTSQNADLQADGCSDPCDLTVSGSSDFDGDGVADACDLDDDNDGILDTDECNSQTPFMVDRTDVFVKSQWEQTGAISIDFNVFDDATSVTINDKPIVESGSEGIGNVPATNVLVATYPIPTDYLDGHSRLTFSKTTFEGYKDETRGTNLNGLPRLQINISIDGEVTLMGTQSINDTELVPVYLAEGKLANIGSLVRNNNKVLILNIPHYDNGLLTGVINFENCTNDYARNLDSDGDGCWDSLEGGAALDQIDPVTGKLLGTVNSDGVIDVNSSTSGLQTNPIGSSQDYSIQVAVCNNLDSDGDGIPDVVEKGNGIIPLDTDGDGIPNYLDLDSDNDGIADEVEAGDNPSEPQDTDGDFVPNYLDLDSDNDCENDVEEVKGGVDENGDGMFDATADADGDGIDDSVDAYVSPATPSTVTEINNGTPVDVTIDDDGTQTYIVTDNPATTDSNGDGFDDGVDLDKDGIIDRCDLIPYQFGDSLDSDGDGIPDVVEIGSNPNEPIDTDGDGIPNYLDLDSDGDGIADEVEAGDNPALPVDTDGDFIPDYLDLDSDNDCENDVDEVTGGIDFIGDGMLDATTDADGDGIDDSVDIYISPATPSNVTEINNGTPVDVTTDDDGTPTYLVPDMTPTTDTNADGYEDGLDSDNDGILNRCDYKPYEFGDVRDSDGDGIPDYIEIGSNPAQPLDTDGDGIPNYLDLDSDNDGVADEVEAGDNPSVPLDTDSDTVPNYLDLDSDNDGENDVDEVTGGIDADGNGMLDPTGDADGDGIDDSVDEYVSPATPMTVREINFGIRVDVTVDPDGSPTCIIPDFSPTNDLNGDGFNDGEDTDRDGILNIDDDLPNEFGDKIKVLPVELITFSVKADGSNAILNWSTQTEVDNDRFEIQKSVDGFTFETIGEVKGNGTKMTASAYNYTDYDVDGTVYYRLRQVDYNGSETYSRTVMLNLTIASISIYPNPTIDYVNVVADEDATVYMFSMTGQLVKVTQPGNIDIRALSSGKYIILVKDSNNKIIKEESIVITK